MQQYADHFGELRQLLSSGTSQQVLQQQTRTSTALKQSTQASRTGGSFLSMPVESLPAIGHPPRETAHPLAVRVHRPSGPLHIPKDTASIPHPRDAAGWEAVHRYLAQRQPLAFDPVPAAAGGAPQASAFQRRPKRGKPTARRSLQKLFDAAAEDSSTFPSFSSDTAEDDDTGCGCATSCQTDDAFPRSCSTPSVAAAQNLTPETPSSGPARSISSFSSIARVPLINLLSSDRGRCLSHLEAKAIFLRIAEDLAALHDANIVHRRVTLADVTLSLSGEFAAAGLEAGKSSERVGTTRCGYGPREQGVEGYLAPEAARCPVERTIHSPACDAWALGVILFALLSGGSLPFGEVGLGSPACVSVMLQSIDAFQQWLDDQLMDKIEFVNDLSNEGARTSGEMSPDMRVLGFDPGAISLTLDLLRADPAQRLVISDVLEHPWLKEVVEMVPRIDGHHHHDRDVYTNGACPGGPGALQPSRAVSDVTRCTESLDFFSSGIDGSAMVTDEPGNNSTNTCGATLVCNGNPGVLPSSSGRPGCPYRLIGHIAQPVKATIDGTARVVGCALHAVYAVPGHGAMMSATPVAVGPHNAMPVGTADPLAGGTTVGAHSASPLFMPLPPVNEQDGTSLWNGGKNLL